MMHTVLYITLKLLPFCLPSPTAVLCSCKTHRSLIPALLPARFKVLTSACCLADTAAPISSLLLQHQIPFLAAIFNWQGRKDVRAPSST